MSAAPLVPGPPRRPRRGLVEGPVLLVATLLASPALWLFGQGLVSLTDALVRSVVVLAGCVLAAAGVRALWPVLAGETDRPGHSRSPLGIETPAPGYAGGPGDTGVTMGAATGGLHADSPESPNVPVDAATRVLEGPAGG